MKELKKPDKFNFNLEVKKPKIQIKDIKNPTLFEINQSFDYISSEDGLHNGIKGEHYARMVVFTNFILGCKPVLLIGSRSSGKTNIISILKRYMKNPLLIEMGSEKADIRDFENLNQASHFIIPEINKITDTFTEILKNLGEGVSTTYKFTDYDRIARSITINPKPFITSVATENKTQRLGEELMSRLTQISTDSSVKQNLKVIGYMLERAQNPYKKQIIPTNRIDDLINYVKSLPSVHDFVFIYLPGKSIIQAIPPIFTDSRRDTQKYLANTNGITLFHFSDHIIINFNKKQHILVTPSDAWYNHRIYNEILIQSSLKVGPLERNILKIVREEPELLSAIEIRNRILKQKNMTTNDVVKKACDTLSEIGYLTRLEDQRPYRYSLNPVLEDDYTGWIDWDEVVEECSRAVKEQFPEHAEEYIQRFCTNPIMVTDPFTGNQLNILDEKPKPTIKVKQVIKQSIKEEIIPEKDEIELLRDKIVEIAKKYNEIDFDKLYNEVQIDIVCEEKIVEREINYLRSVSELLYVNGKIKILE